MLGLLFVGYHGNARLFTKCDTDACFGPSKTGYHILYVFPRWVLNLAMFIQVNMQGPEMLIRCLRVRPFATTPVFQLLAQGQHNQVQRLLSIGQASVLDVSEAGKSLLQVSQNSRNYHISPHRYGN